MPHVARFCLDGVRLPSVSTITGTLAKDGIIRWQRKLGFEEADRQSYVAARQGTKVATMFEKYRKRGRKPRAEYLKTVLNEWVTWGEGWKDVELVAEPHLVNTVDMYHGSPDLVFKDSGKWNLGDDKSKKRFADYGLLMNEHMYAMCDRIHDMETDQLRPVPWTIPIEDIWFWTYNPVTGKLYPHHHKFDPKVYADAMVCRKMYEVNRTASKYFDMNAVLLPEAQ
jgi:hypothetical protein